MWFLRQTEDLEKDLLREGEVQFMSCSLHTNNQKGDTGAEARTPCATLSTDGGACTEESTESGGALQL